MVKQPSNKQVKQRKETSATARRRFPPTPRLPSPSSTPATYTVALELVCESLVRIDAFSNLPGASMPGDKPSHRPAPRIDGGARKKPAPTTRVSP